MSAEQRPPQVDPQFLRRLGDGLETIAESEVRRARRRRRAGFVAGIALATLLVATVVFAPQFVGLERQQALPVSSEGATSSPTTPVTQSPDPSATPQPVPEVTVAEVEPAPPAVPPHGGANGTGTEVDLYITCQGSGTVSDLSSLIVDCASLEPGVIVVRLHTWDNDGIEDVISSADFTGSILTVPSGTTPPLSPASPTTMTATAWVRCDNPDNYDPAPPVSIGGTIFDCARFVQPGSVVTIAASAIPVSIEFLTPEIRVLGDVQYGTVYLQLEPAQ